MENINTLENIYFKKNPPEQTYKIEIEGEDFFTLNFENQNQPHENLYYLINLLNLSKSSKKWTISIKNLPGLNDVPVNLHLKIFENNEDSVFDISIWDDFDVISNREMPMVHMNKKEYLGYVNSSESVSGTLVMKVWDHLYSLFRPTKVAILDDARFQCRHCEEYSTFSIKLWRIFSNRCAEGSELPGSWYENFGYKIEKVSEPYKNAVQFLSTLTLGSLKDIYEKSQLPKQILLLKRCYAFALDKETVEEIDPLYSFSAVLQKLEKETKKENIDSKTHKLFHEIKKQFFSSFEEIPKSVDLEEPMTFGKFMRCIKFVQYSHQRLTKRYFMG